MPSQFASNWCKHWPWELGILGSHQRSCSTLPCMHSSSLYCLDPHMPVHCHGLLRVLRTCACRVVITHAELPDHCSRSLGSMWIFSSLALQQTKPLQNFPPWYFSCFGTTCRKWGKTPALLHPALELKAQHNSDNVFNLLVYPLDF